MAKRVGLTTPKPNRRAPERPQNKPRPPKTEIVRYVKPKAAPQPEPKPKEPAIVLQDVQGALVEAGTMPTPESRIFRDAWVLSGDAVVVDMAAARGIHRDRLRTARAPLLRDLDVDYMKALEMGDMDGMEAIADMKQRLRDITQDPRLDAAETPDALAALTIDALLSS